MFALFTRRATGGGNRARLQLHQFEDRLTPSADPIADNLDAAVTTLTGTWPAATAGTGYYGADYLTDGNADKGTKSARFGIAVPSAGRYDVAVRWPAVAGLASAVPVDVSHDAGTTTLTVNQQAGGGTWVSLGAFDLGTVPAAVTLRTGGTVGPVAADAVRVRDASNPDRVFYAGAAGREALHSLVTLSDGTVLAGGGASDAAWIPAGTPVVQLGGTGGITNPGGTGQTAFLARFSADLSTVLGVYTLPAGAAEDVRHVKLTSVPGAATGSVVLSGTTQPTNGSARDGGYFVAKLNGNFVDSAPTALSWVRNVWATGDHQTFQPWDVGGDGKVVYALGQPFGADWAAVQRFKADGTDDVVPEWRYQGGTTAGGVQSEGVYQNAAAATAAGLTVDRSAIILKNGRGQLRSWTPAEYSATTPDGNGGTRQGTWPQDLYYNAAYNPAAPLSNGPGYTGYRTGAAATQRVGGITVDRRTNDFYLGYSTQSRLPDGNPDFEPAVVAMSPSGALKWWSRLYTEQGSNSTPDQYVDGLAVDYSKPPAESDLVVLARAHGNNTFNLWRGDSVLPANNPQNPGRGFQNQFTGTQGNIHISWLGRLKQTTGALTAATYVAEYAEGATGLGAASTDPNLDGWADPNSGWPTVNTTRLETSVSVDPDGRVVVVGAGRRTITTAGAFQKMPKPGAGVSSWNEFVRVYSADLSAAVYSSVLTGRWDLTTGAGGDNLNVRAAVPVPGGLLLAGFNKADAANVAAGNPAPTAGVPAWGTDTPKGQDFVLGRLVFAPTVAAVRPNAGAAQRSRVTSLTVTFTTPVTIAPGAFTLARTAGTGGGSPVVSFTTALVNGRTLVTLTFASSAGLTLDAGSLPDGRYTLAVDATKVTGPGGAALAGAGGPGTDFTGAGLHRLFGDADGDGDVDTVDLARFRQAFTGAVPNPAFDFDNNGVVDTVDLARFRQRFGTVI